MTSEISPAVPPAISLVVPVYNMVRHLREFLDSLDRQSEAARRRVEVVFVDDGSTDASLSVVRRWAEDAEVSTHVVTQANAGPCVARNTGLERATGTWVSFPDPDDVLSDDYLDTVLGAVDPAPDELMMICTRILLFEQHVVDATDSHPLRHKFARSVTTLNLDEFPRYFHLSGPTAFLRRAELERQQLRFNPAVRPHFEDADLVARYLFGASRPPRVTLLRDATYYYRRPPENDSMVQTSHSRPEKYTDLLREGYIAVLRDCKETLGAVPTWLELAILYDISWILRADQEVHPASAALPDAVIDTFHELVRELLALISVEAIESFVDPVPTVEHRQVLLAMRGTPRPPRTVNETRVDGRQHLQRLSYFYSGHEPREELRSNGVPVEAAHSKRRAVVYLRRTVLWERIAWVDSLTPITVSLDGEPATLVRGRQTSSPSMLLPREPGHPRVTGAGDPAAGTTRRAGALTRLSADAALGVRALAVGRITARDAGRELTQRVSDRIAMTAYKTTRLRSRFAGCWLFIDRDTQAQDNAEHLYRYVRTHRPDINAFFVLSKASPDWARLETEGFRLVEIGSIEHLVALKNCAHLLSSQIDHYIVRPLDARRHGASPWKFTFLQHGITKDDCSRWFNKKPISLLVTGTPDETASIVGDGSPYVYTDKEVKMTGFPRFDALLQKSQALAPEDRDLVLIMPSWRERLLRPVASGNHRDVIEGFWESDYVVSWMGLLRSERLRDAARARGLEIVFMPHPNMQPHVTADQLPDHVRLRTYSDGDLQEVIARAAVAITDYSSIVFDAAFLEARIGYFQFDADTFFDGSQPYQKGYFDYTRDGFGPVATTLADSVADTVELVGLDAPAPVYLSRMRAAFPVRDGKNSERVVLEVERL